MKRNQSGLLRNSRGGAWGQKVTPRRSAGDRIPEHWDLGRTVVSPTHLQSDTTDATSVTLPTSCL